MKKNKKGKIVALKHSVGTKKKAQWKGYANPWSQAVGKARKAMGIDSLAAPSYFAACLATPAAASRSRWFFHFCFSFVLFVPVASKLVLTAYNIFFFRPQRCCRTTSLDVDVVEGSTTALLPRNSDRGLHGNESSPGVNGFLAVGGKTAAGKQLLAKVRSLYKK